MSFYASPSLIVAPPARRNRGTFFLRDAVFDTTQDSASSSPKTKAAGDRGTGRTAVENMDSLRPKASNTHW